MRISIGTLVSVVFLSACAGTEHQASDVERTQRGDTLILRSRGDGAWGAHATLERTDTFGEAEGSDTVTLGQITALAANAEYVYATDRQLKAIRVFDRQLRFVALWGREGSGPAELRNPDGGLATLSDGRIAVRDPGNARLQLFGRNGESAGEWRVVDAGLRTRDNFGMHGDTLLSRVVIKSEGPIDSWEYGLARIAADGRILDTVLLPTPTLPRTTLVARKGSNTAELALPFAPLSLWAWHPRGGFVTAAGNTYAITWPRDGGRLRVERAVEPVAVNSAESEQERAYVTKGLQWLDPAWTWTGPPIPSTKPLLSQLITGRDGSVWALREGVAVDGDDADYRPGDPASVERRLRSQYSFDVFSATGDFLGTVRVPSTLQLRPQPVVDAVGLIALEMDSTGVPRLSRFRVRARSSK